MPVFDPDGKTAKIFHGNGGLPRRNGPRGPIRVPNTSHERRIVDIESQISDLNKNVDNLNRNIRLIIDRNEQYRHLSVRCDD